MKQTYYWWKQLFWMIGKFIEYLVCFEFDYAIETTYWIRIHLTYKGTRIK